jgi:hypothetical protein
VSRRTEDDEARDLIADLNSRGFRICEYKKTDTSNYLNDYKEWDPISDRRAITVLAMLLPTATRDR